MHFKSVLAHLNHKFSPSANHGGWSFFTLETCWIYVLSGSAPGL